MTDNLILANKQDVIRIADALRAKENITTTYDWDTLVTKAVEAIISSGGSAEELLPSSRIPDYIKEEALRVANAVEAARVSDSIVFLAMSDNHHYAAEGVADIGLKTDEGNLHANMAAKVLSYALDMDFVTHLGDQAWGSESTSETQLKLQISQFSSYFKEALKGKPCFCAIGNHDSGIYGTLNDASTYLYNHFTALINNSTDGNPIDIVDTNGGYCYKDFITKKLRVFLLNTSEGLIASSSESAQALTNNQLEWFAKALKELNTNKSDWNFIILSHYPADYGTNITRPLSNLLYVYQSGGSITINGTSYNFSGANTARFIAQFHGHIHNFLVSNLYYGNTPTGYNAKRICIPNGSYDRNNHQLETGYGGIVYKEATTYEKIPKIAKETSFVVNVINPTEKVIYSFTYGAGPEKRVISYGDITYYNVTSSLTNVSLESNFSVVAEGETYTGVISFNKPDYKYKNVKIEYDGDYSYDEDTGLITVPNVQGDIKIIASGTNYKNLIPYATKANSTEIYGNNGYINEYAITENGGAHGTTKMYNTGYMPIDIQKPIYFKNLSFIANGSGNNTQRISFYNNNYEFLGSINAVSWYFYSNYYPADRTKNLVMCKVKIDSYGANIQGTDGSGTGIYIKDPSTIKFFRVTALSMDDSSIITIDENPYEDDPDNPFNTYSITQNLSSAITASNISTTIPRNTSYYNTLTIANGYQWDNITIKMNGNDITNNAGVLTIEGTTANIYITSLNGDIEIIANHKVDLPVIGTGNQIRNAYSFTGSQPYGINGLGYDVGTLSSSTTPAGRPNGTSGYHTGCIRFDVNKVVNFENITFNTSNGNSKAGRLVFYDENLAYIGELHAGTTSNVYYKMRVPATDTINNLTKFQLTGVLSINGTNTNCSDRIKYIAVSTAYSNGITDQSTITFTDS